MFDPRPAAGTTGCEQSGANLNQGAESTLALLSTAQQARRLLVPDMSGRSPTTSTRSCDPIRAGSSPGCSCPVRSCPSCVRAPAPIVARVLALPEDRGRGAGRGAARRLLLAAPALPRRPAAQRFDGQVARPAARPSCPSSAGCCWARASPRSTPSRGPRCAIRARCCTPIRAGLAAVRCGSRSACGPSARATSRPSASRPPSSVPVRRGRSSRACKPLVGGTSSLASWRREHLRAVLADQGNVDELSAHRARRAARPVQPALDLQAALADAQPDLLGRPGVAGDRRPAAPAGGVGLRGRPSRTTSR